MTNSERVWFITGVSSGFGRTLAEEAARAGDKVIGTVRQAKQIEEFNAISPGSTFAYILDVTRPDGVKATVEAAFKHFNRLDIIVNNAGFGLLGAVEEVSVEEYRQVMETNFFGALLVTQAVLPYLRAQQRGHILQMSSTSGFRGTTGFGAYNASKFALEGMSEALAQEVGPLNIKVTIVEPGPFRTNFTGAGIKVAKRQMEEYDSTAGVFKAAMQAGHNEQAGDPTKAAKVLLELVNADNPPLHLPLGQFAFNVIRAKLHQMQQNLDDWENIASKTSFDNSFHE